MFAMDDVEMSVFHGVESRVDLARSAAVRAGEEPVTVRAWNKKTLSEALAFDPQLLAK